MNNRQRSPRPTWSRRRPARGNATVEFAMIAPLLLLLVFGTVEFGLVFKSVLTLNQACREAARTAGVGAPTADVLAAIQDKAPSLAAAYIVPELEYREYVGSSWGTWLTLGDMGTTPDANDAPSGAQIRVALQYEHQFICGQLLSDLLSDGTGLVTLNSVMTARRE